MGTGLYYDLPGMAEKPDTRAPNLAKSVFSGDRSSYLKHINFPKSEYIALPGMADEIKSDRRGSLAFKLSGSGGSRDSYVQAAHKTTGLVYNVPGMAESLARDSKGSAAFRMSSPRRTGSPRTSSPSRNPAAGGRESPRHSPAEGVGTGGALPPGAADARVVGGRFSVDPYDIPGMAEAVLRSPKGTAAFRMTSPRGDYVKKFQQTNDLIYDIPGMSGVVYGSGGGERRRSPIRQQQQQQQLGSPVSAGGGGGVLRSSAASQVEPFRRFDSPTKASIARKEAVARETEQRESERQGQL
jgi:hypothetical protein